MTSSIDDELWSAIADPSRRRVLDLLIHHGEATASSLAAKVPFSRQAVSKHLLVLEGVGLVRRRKQGREVRYRVIPDQLGAVTEIMDRLSNEWSQRLATIKRLAEEGRGDASNAGAVNDPNTGRAIAR